MTALHRSPIRRLGFIALVCLLLASIGLAAAQGDELTETASFTENGLTLSIDHPTGWVTSSDDEALYIANTQATLDVMTTGVGALESDTIGFILYAPSLVDTLDLPADADNVAALTALLEVRGLPEYSTGTVYKGSPAVAFFQKPTLEGASTDLFAFDLDSKIVFMAQVYSGDFFMLSQAMFATVALSESGATDVPAVSDEPRDLVVTVADAEDETLTYDFTATLPVGWVEFYDEETGTLILASSTAALDIATAALAVAEDETSDTETEVVYERGDSVIEIVLPTVLKGLEVDTTASVDSVLTAFAATLGLEVFPSLTERNGVPAANALVILENVNGGVTASLYAYAFPDGVVITIVYPDDGSGNPAVSDVLKSISYGLTVAAEE